MASIFEEFEEFEEFVDGNDSHSSGEKHTCSPPIKRLSHPFDELLDFDDVCIPTLCK